MRTLLFFGICLTMVLSLEVGAQDISPLRLQIRELHDLEDHKGIISLLDSVSATQELSAEFSFYKGRALFNAGRTSEARLILRPLENHSALGQLAISLHENKKYQESIRWLQTARSLKDSPQLIYYLARNFDLFYQDKQPALQHYQMFIDRAGDGLEEQRTYARQRVRELREILHLQGE